MGEPHGLTGIVVDTHEQFLRWCYDNDRNPRDPSLKVIRTIQDARGRWFDRIVELGGSAYLLSVAESRLRPPAAREA